MANQSILAAFERMWMHITDALATKQPVGDYAMQSDIAALGSLATKDTVSKSDLASDIQTSLGKADTAIQSIDGLATETYVDNKISAIEIPTKVSELTNDSGYLTSIPSEYITETELSAKGYITGYTETDPTVPAWAKAASKPTYTASEVGAPTVAEMNAAIAAIPTPDVSGQINTHNSSNTAHSDIRNLINEKAPMYTYSTTDLTIGISSLTTGKMYLVYD